MGVSVVFALVGSGFNIINDLIYGKTSLTTRQEGVYPFYFLASFTSAITALVINLTLYGAISFDIVNMAFGVWLGILSFLVYIMFLLGFSSNNAVVNITIYRLNLIPGSILAVVLLNEHISISRGIGISLCVATIALFALKGRVEGAQKNKYLYLSIGACFLGGFLNLSNKVAVMNGGLPFALLLWRFITVVVLCSVFLLKGNFKIVKTINKANIKFALFSGFALLMAIFFILNALKVGDVTLVIPITQLSFIITVIISALLLKEKIGKFKAIGVALALAAVFFML